VTWWAVYSEIPERIGYTTIDLNVNDFSMHRGGTLYGEAKAVRVGRSIAMSEGWVKDENGRILAFGTSKLMILDEKSSLEAAIEGLGHDPLPRKFIDIED
ncbi:MAG: PaaI family thioesterase, partial [Eubacterium sp.]|nr:PaaI family thioesterase [Eubacterium sp.]